jgi:hypothetical protein
MIDAPYFAHTIYFAHPRVALRRSARRPNPSSAAVPSKMSDDGSGTAVAVPNVKFAELK